jgi:protein-tyrosine phosphatase
MSQVLPYLWIGDNSVARDYHWLRLHGITHIINVAKEVPNYFPDGFVYQKIPLSDTLTENIKPFLEPIASYIHITHFYNPKTKFLVHCFAGVSRSASVVLYYLAKLRKWTFRQALLYLKMRRPMVNPNINFRTTLVHVLS